MSNDERLAALEDQLKKELRQTRRLWADLVRAFVALSRHGKLCQALEADIENLWAEMTGAEKQARPVNPSKRRRKGDLPPPSMN